MYSVSCIVSYISDMYHNKESLQKLLEKQTSHTYVRMFTKFITWSNTAKILHTYLNFIRWTIQNNVVLITFVGFLNQSKYTNNKWEFHS